MMRTVRAAMSRRKPVTKFLILGVVVVSCVAYLVFVSLLNVESMQKEASKGQIVGSDAASYDGPVFPDQVKARGGEEESNETLKFVDEDPLDVARVAEYCNIPTKVMDSEEGEAPKNYLLSSVYVIIRHGDRTPMTSFLNIPRPSPPQGCTMDREFLQTVPELRNFLSDLESQRDRQPERNDFASWSLYPQHTDCGSSQLTGRGALQHLFNGLTLRQKYVKKHKLFGSHFDPTKQLNIRSTQISRTYQSAVSLLYGFLPHFNISQLDIQAARNIMFCSSSLVPPECCTNLAKLRQEADKARIKSGNKNPLWVSSVGALAKVFDVKPGRLPWPAALVDTLQGHACHGLPLPCASQGKCVTASMLEKLWKLVDSDGSSFSVNTAFDRYCRTVVHSLLLELLTNMVKVSRNQSHVKFSLYSGHDLTVTPLLQTLGLYNGKWPHYATRLVFELYRKMRSKGEHYLRILHNGKDVTAQVKFCRGKMEDGMCPLKYFQYFINKDNLELIGVSDRQSLQSFCKINAQT